MDRSKFRSYVPLVFFVVLAVLSVFILSPFIISAVLGATVAYIVYPLYLGLKGKISSKSVSAFLISLGLFLVVFLPGILLARVLVRESYVLYLGVRKFLAQGLLLDECTNALCSSISNVFGPYNITFSIQEVTRSVANSIAEWGSTLALSLPHFFLTLFVFFFVFYYMLKDGEKFIEALPRYLGIDHRSYGYFLRRVKEVLAGVLYGYFAVALLQGILGGLGFLILGLDSPVFWGIVMALAAMIPFLGTGLVWLPASLILIYQGVTNDTQGLIIKGIILFLYGLFVVSSIDNIIRPKLIGDRAKIHPAIILLGLLGGIVFIGPSGVIIGPLVLSMTLIIAEYSLRPKNSPKV